jgi:anti-sigma B factor antagonist
MAVHQDFVAATAQLDNGTPVVSVMGEIDLATAPVLKRTLLQTAETGTPEVVVDLTGCRFLDSHGLRALMEAKGRLERSDRSLALVVSSPIVMRVFQLTQFDKSFDIYPSLSALKPRLTG